MNYVAMFLAGFQRMAHGFAMNLPLALFVWLAARKFLVWSPEHAFETALVALTAGVSLDFLFGLREIRERGDIVYGWLLEHRKRQAEGGS